MINFYHRFIPTVVTILHPFYCALKGNSQKQVLVWSTKINAAYNDGTSALSNATLLAHPHPEAPKATTSDASDTVVGACMQQFGNGHWQPMAFISKQLQDPERNYSTFGREMLALYFAIRGFTFLVEGKIFTIFTYHKLLLDAIFKVSYTWTA